MAPLPDGSVPGPPPVGSLLPRMFWGRTARTVKKAMKESAIQRMAKGDRAVRADATRARCIIDFSRLVCLRVLLSDPLPPCAADFDQSAGSAMDAASTFPRHEHEGPSDTYVFLPGGTVQQVCTVVPETASETPDVDWIANGFGGISVFWTGAVILGAFCSQLVAADFWSATAIIFIEAFRLFNREHKLGSTSWFQTRKSLRLISLPLGSKSQQRNVALLIATLFVSNLSYCPVRAGNGIAAALFIVLLIKLRFPWEQCHWFFFLWVLLFGVIGISGWTIYILVKNGDTFFACLTLAGVLQQVPTSVACIIVSVWRLRSSSAYTNDIQNLQRALTVFYYVVILQASSYVFACVMDFILVFLRKSVIRWCGLRGKHGVKFVDLYYEHIYTEYMEGRVHALDELDLPAFAMRALNSKSSQLQLNGLQALHSFLLQNDIVIISKISTSAKVVTQLLRMVGWTETEHQNIRILASKVLAEVAPRLIISCVPGAMVVLSSFLDCENLKDCLTPGDESDNRGNVMGNGYPTLGLCILERLACQVGNVEEISKASDLIAKVVFFTGYTMNTRNTNIVEQRAVLISSLRLVKILARTGGKLGVKIRKVLSENLCLVINLSEVLDNSHADPEILHDAIVILSMLSMDMKKKNEIGAIPIIIRRLMNIFLGDCFSNYNPALRKVAGNALTVLTIENTRNNLTILKEPGYHLIQDLKKMLLEDDYRLISARILSNICAYASSELCQASSHEQLSSPIQQVMELLLQAEGKELEVLVFLTSRIRNVIPICFAQHLESFTSAGIFVQKLVSEYARKKPSLDCPRMRRVIMELATSVVEACPHYAILFRDHGMMDALDRVEQNPSRLENFSFVYGGESMALESCDDLSIQVAKTKTLLGTTRP
ncbi:hypothetical protein PR202_ga12101 [Eleusine coracana subsp. coracana]|uniref:Uncharacterized protein n=1 Tax=Eleusine coracana subsp. coracana TaxID=191504 RepID=A0AAV5CAT1_ELECO|nr:hypothetical protein PR202_ga12101 [Eleusine coracana subsp. coracana]